jgi:hypothetical protein
MIDTEEQSFMEYVEWLEAEDEETGKIFNFESVLKYVNFPDLNAQIPSMVKT